MKLKNFLLMFFAVEGITTIIREGLLFIIKNFLKYYYLKRLPEVLTVILAFSLSFYFSVPEEQKKIIIENSYNVWMFVLLFLLTIPIAIFDYVCTWCRERL